MAMLFFARLLLFAPFLILLNLQSANCNCSSDPVKSEISPTNTSKCNTKTKVTNGKLLLKTNGNGKSQTKKSKLKLKPKKVKQPDSGKKLKNLEPEGSENSMSLVALQKLNSTKTVTPATPLPSIGRNLQQLVSNSISTLF